MEALLKNICRLQGISLATTLGMSATWWDFVSLGRPGIRAGTRKACICTATVRPFVVGDVHSPVIQAVREVTEEGSGRWPGWVGATRDGQVRLRLHATALSGCGQATAWSGYGERRRRR